MNKHQHWAVWIAIVVFVLYAMTYSPYKVWGGQGYISPAPRGNLFRTPRHHNALTLDLGRFAGESGFIIVLAGGITLALSPKRGHGHDAKT